MLESYLIHTLTTIKQPTSTDAYGKSVYTTVYSSVPAKVEKGENRSITPEGREIATSV